jgi:transposase
MPKPIAEKVRLEILAFIDQGHNSHEAAERFQVSRSAVTRFLALRRRTGGCCPRPMGGDRRSLYTEAYAPMILAELAAHKTITLVQLQSRLAEQGIQVTTASLWRFLQRHSIPRSRGSSRRSYGAGAL